MGWNLFVDSSTLAKMGRAQILPDLFKMGMPVYVTGTVLAEVRQGATLGFIGSQRALTWIEEHRNGPLLKVVDDEPAPGTLQDLGGASKELPMSWAPHRPQSPALLRMSLMPD